MGLNLHFLSNFKNLQPRKRALVVRKSDFESSSPVKRILCTFQGKSLQSNEKNYDFPKITLPVVSKLKMRHTLFNENVFIQIKNLMYF